jgi:hypothetical protein
VRADSGDRLARCPSGCERTRRYAHLAPGLESGEMERAFGEIKERPGLVEDAATAYAPEGPLRLAV